MADDRQGLQGLFLEHYSGSVTRSHEQRNVQLTSIFKSLQRRHARCLRTSSTFWRASVDSFVLLLDFLLWYGTDRKQLILRDIGDGSLARFGGGVLGVMSGGLPEDILML